MNRDLVRLLDGFRGARVALIGDLVADEFLYGETDRISREAPVLIVRHESSELKPGCAANAAANLCSLGARVEVIGVVGSDDTGARLRALLEARGADVRGVFTADGAPTATKTRVLAGGRHTRRQQMLRIDREGPGAPGPALLPRLLSALRAAAARGDVVLVSDYGLGLLAPPVVEALARMKVCVDSRFALAQYRGVLLAKPNEVELQQAVGRGFGEDAASLEEAGRELLKTLRAEALLVTRGRSGMALLRPGAPTALVEAHGTAEAVDVTGAGDTVMAVTTLALAAGADPVQAMRLANVAGALVVQKPGTAALDAAELRAELERGPVAAPTVLARRMRAVKGRR